MTPTRKAKGAEARATSKPATAPATAPAATRTAAKRRTKRESSIPESGMPESGLRPSLRGAAIVATEEVTKTAAESTDVPLEAGPPPSARQEIIADAPPAEVVRTPPTVAEIDELARSLGDPVAHHSDAWLHYQVVLTELGGEGVRSLVSRARDVEANGGLTVVAGERKRTLGGVFFALAREAVGPEKWRALRKAVRQNVQKAPPAPKNLRPEPEVLLVRRRSSPG